MSEEPKADDLISQLQADLHLRLEQWRSEYDNMTLPDMIATLGIVIADLCMELEILNEFEDKENEDDNGML